MSDDVAHVDEDDPAEVYEALSVDAASDAHLEAARRAEIERLKSIDPKDPQIDYINGLLGAKRGTKKAKAETADKPPKSASEQR